MSILIWAYLILVAVASLAGLLIWQIRLIRLGEVRVSNTDTNLWSLCQRQIDRLYSNLTFFLKHFGHYFYFYSLTVGHQSVIVFKYLLTRVEKKFSRLIDSIRGRGVIEKKGSASFFLTQIKSGDK